MYASLLRLNAKIELEPALVEKYEVSKDSTVITFMLRKGLTFHDGKPVTAEDVKFTLEALASPQLEGCTGCSIWALTSVMRNSI